MFSKVFLTSLLHFFYANRRANHVDQFIEIRILNENNVIVMMITGMILFTFCLLWLLGHTPKVCEGSIINKRRKKDRCMETITKAL